MSVINITKKDFENEVLKSEKPVLIDFWAAWCGPCKLLSPVVDALADEISDEVKVVKVNVDDEPELATQFNIMSIPTLVVIREGNEVNRSMGLQSKQDILNLVAK